MWALRAPTVVWGRIGITSKRHIETAKTAGQGEWGGRVTGGKTPRGGQEGRQPSTPFVWVSYVLINIHTKKQVFFCLREGPRKKTGLWARREYRSTQPNDCRRQESGVRRLQKRKEVDTQVASLFNGSQRTGIYRCDRAGRWSFCGRPGEDKLRSRKALLALATLEARNSMPRET